MASKATTTKTKETPATTKVVRVLTGTVVSTAMDKTAVVAVHTTKTHAKYGKRYGSTTKYKVHDPENAARVGDMVSFQACRPISREKRWLLVQ